MVWIVVVVVNEPYDRIGAHGSAAQVLRGCQGVVGPQMFC